MSELEPTRTYSNPTANDILRRMLDERGVEWTYEDGTVSFNDGGRWFHAWAYNDGTVCVSMGYITPEQAIAATLGSCNRSSNCTNSERTETCHEIEDEDTGFIVCSECGAVHDESYTAYYCWCCGRRIEQ